MLSARRLAVLILLLLVPLLFSGFIAPQVYAQYSVASYAQPNMDDNVPRNQHTYTQSVIIEMLSAVICQLSGIDPIDPKTPCLGVDMKTNKIGYLPSGSNNGLPVVGGLLGNMSGLYSMLYVPPASTTVYAQYISQKFGIVEKAEAAGIACNPNNSSSVVGLGYGYCSLHVIMGLWSETRNIAYFGLVLAFIFIGIGVMLRVRIDPRTVMTIQNQIPRIVICILLITFSYAIAGVMVDTMWVATYAGINLLTTTDKPPDPKNPQIGGATGGCQSNDTFSYQSNVGLLDTPISYVNEVFKSNCQNFTGSGLATIDGTVAKAMGGIIQDLVAHLLGVPPGTACIDLNPFASQHFNGGACLSDIVGFLATFVMIIIVFITILIVLFRTWFELLKAYMFTLIYIAMGPIWIVFGLLPGRPLGFEKWLRSLFVNLAVFPATACLFVGARVIQDVFNNAPDPKSAFIPPLVGNPNMKNFGILVSFGMLLMAPTLLTMLRESMKVPGTKHGAAIGQAFSQGRAIPGMLANKQWANWNRRNSQTGAPEGVISRFQDDATKWAVTHTIGKAGPWMKRKVAEHYERKENQYRSQGARTHAEVAAGYAGSKADEDVRKIAQHQASERGEKDWSGKSWGEMRRGEKKKYAQIHADYTAALRQGKAEEKFPYLYPQKQATAESSESAKPPVQKNPLTEGGDTPAQANAQTAGTVNLQANTVNMQGKPGGDDTGHILSPGGILIPPPDQIKDKKPASILFNILASSGLKEAMRTPEKYRTPEQNKEADDLNARIAQALSGKDYANKMHEAMNDSEKGDLEALAQQLREELKKNKPTS